MGVLLVGFLSVSLSTSAEIWYVDQSATGANDGTSWTHAYHEIQDALASAEAGHEIYVAAGIYTRESVLDLVVITMKPAVDIYGGYPSGGGLRDPVTNPTHIDGEHVAYHVVVGASDAVIDGFIIENGEADGTGYETRGGGMFNSNVSPTIISCVFKDNSASGAGIAQGGAVYNLNSSAAFKRCTFVGNSCPDGGAVRNNVSIVGPPSFTSCRFLSNSAPGGMGGAVVSNAVEVTFTNCAFYDNSAERGGAIFDFSDTPTNLVNCTFTLNSASDQGGGYYGNVSSPATMTNCIFWGNVAPNYPDIFDDSGGSTSRYCDIQQPEGINGYQDDGTGGTIHVDPEFFGGGSLRLSAGSPCIDAGDGSALADTVDLDGGPRFVDDPGTADTGIGPPPFLDMGPYEWADCNENGIDDGQDIADSTSLDANRNGIPDECEPSTVMSDQPRSAPMIHVIRNSPNPFNAVTTIRFHLATRQRVRLTVYSPDGCHVARLLDEHRPAGLHEVSWNGRNVNNREVASGIYLCRLETDRSCLTSRMLLLK